MTVFAPIKDVVGIGSMVVSALHCRELCKNLGRHCVQKFWPARRALQGGPSVHGGALPAAADVAKAGEPARNLPPATSTQSLLTFGTQSPS